MKNFLTFFLVVYIGFFGVVKTSLAAILFRDNFEYDVARDVSGKSNLFRNYGGWTSAKSEPEQTGANGYLFTTASIPGFSGSLPGQDSNKVLAIESRSLTEGLQTDFYLLYGNTENPDNNNLIPGNVWLQFWIYINNYGSEQTCFHSREKFVYPCNGPYPCNSGKWLFMIGADSYNPLFVSPYGNPSANGEAFLIERDNQVGSVVYSPGLPDNPNKLGQHTISEYLAPNRWSLVRLHFDTSTTAGTWEAWIKSQGGNFTKVAEWISGITPNFSWTLAPGEVGGHRGFKMPSTMPGANVAPLCNAWIYMDDFIMADSESSLPSYTSSDITAPAAPTGLSIN